MKTKLNKVSFQPPVIRDYTPGRIKKLKPFYERILLGVLDAMLARYERNPHYHFIDTKLSVITGRDFEKNKQSFRGLNTIYAWIQGRGLESLAGHAAWLKSCSLLSAAEKENRTARIRKILREVAAEMEIIRRKNNGQIHFCFNPAGKPLEITARGNTTPFKGAFPPGSNLSDIFYAKGLLAAAAYLNDSALTMEALRYLRRVINDITEGNFYSDQQSLDPKNKVKPIPGQCRYAQWMIGLAGLTLATELTGEKEWFATGVRFIWHVLGHHLNLNRFPPLKKYDLFEATDAAGRPWTDGGKILCDPGHALEFIGLATKLLLMMKKKNIEETYGEFFGECRIIFPEIFRHVFQLGFNAKAGGICKAFDLVGRAPINSDLPWWNLPETMRAGAELLALGTAKSHHQEILKIIVLCSNSFLRNFINPQVHFMAYQTRNAQGRMIDVIPAVPDADPGYHTGLSMIDFLAIVASGNIAGGNIHV